MSMYDAEGYLRRAQNAEKVADARVSDLCKCVEALLKIIKDMEKKPRPIGPMP